MRPSTNLTVPHQRREQYQCLPGHVAEEFVEAAAGARQRQGGKTILPAAAGVRVEVPVAGVRPARFWTSSVARASY